MEFFGTVSTEVHIDNWIYNYRQIIILLFESNTTAISSMVFPVREFTSLGYTGKVFGNSSDQWGSCSIIDDGGYQDYDGGYGTTFLLNRTSSNTVKLHVYGIVGTTYYIQ